MLLNLEKLIFLITYKNIYKYNKILKKSYLYKYI